MFITITVSQASFVELLFNKPVLTGQCLGLNIAMRVRVNNFTMLCLFRRCLKTLRSTVGCTTTKFNLWFKYSTLISCMSTKKQNEKFQINKIFLTIFFFLFLFFYNQLHTDPQSNIATTLLELDEKLLTECNLFLSSLKTLYYLTAFQCPIKWL